MRNAGLSSYQPVADETLHVIVDRIVDPDGDEISLHVRWFVNDEVVTVDRESR